MNLLRLAVIAIVCSLSIGVREARANEPTQQALAREARNAERAMQPALAETLYQRALAIDEKSRASRNIRARLSWLREHSDDGYRPLMALMRFQRLPAEERTSERIAAFERELDGFPPCRVTREGLAMVARLYLDELDDPAAALAVFQRWQRSPGASEAERRLAAAGSARALERMQGPTAALDELRRAGMSHSPAATRMRAERVARVGAPIALTLIAVALLGAAWLGRWRSWSAASLRKAFSGSRVALAAYVLVPPALMAWYYDRTSAAKLGRWLLVLAGVVTLSALVGATLDDGVARRKVRWLDTLAGLATLAAGFLMAAKTGMLLDIMLGWEQAP